MDLNNLFKSLSISASGMSAERFKMGLIASNIAHARDTDTGNGLPYRRKDAVFATILEGELAGGVEVADWIEDRVTPMQQVYMPGHPHADANGMVTMPNVNPHNEMVDMIMSSRTYEANLEASRIAIELARQALDIGR